MKGIDDMHEVDGDILVSTQKAILFHGDYWPEEKEVWFSRRVLGNIEQDLDDPGRATILIPDWLMKKEELLDYE